MSKDLLQTFLLGIHSGPYFLCLCWLDLLIRIFIYKWWRNLLFRVPDRGKKRWWLGVNPWDLSLCPKWKNKRGKNISTLVTVPRGLSCRHWATLSLLYIYWVSLSFTTSWEPWGCSHDWRTLPSGRKLERVQETWKMPSVLNY